MNILFKKKIIILLFITQSCTVVGVGISECKVQGDLVEGVEFYPLKPNDKSRIKKFNALRIEIIERKLIDSDSTNDVKREYNWFANNLKSKKGVIVYGQKKNQSLVTPKGLKIMREYGVGLSINSFFYNRLNCGCKFRIDENGEVINIPITKD